MLCIHCDDPAEIDAAWRMLLDVPPIDWRPIELHCGARGALYLIVRTSQGDQTTVPLAGLRGCRTPAL